MNSTLIHGELQHLFLRIVKVEHLPGRWPAKNIGQRMVCSERIFSALDIRPAGAAFLENAGWNYFVYLLKH